MKISYSKLRKLLVSPTEFHKYYILQDREEKYSPYAALGSAIHCLILEPNTFHDKFVITPKLPSEKVLNILNKLHEFKVNTDDKRTDLEDYSEELLQLLREFDLYQSFKEDRKRLEKIITDNTEEYWDFLVQGENKIVLTEENFNKAVTSAEAIFNDNTALTRLGLKKTFENYEILNELDLEFDLIELDSDSKISIHGVIDRLVINEEERTARVCEIKRMYSLYSCLEDIEKYNYDIQAGLYYIIIKNQKRFKDYKIEYCFIIVDEYNQVGVIDVSTITLEKWSEKVVPLLKRLKYHFENNDFTKPYEFLIGGGAITI